MSQEKSRVVTFEEISEALAVIEKYGCSKLLKQDEGHDERRSILLKEGLEFSDNKYED